MHDTPSDNPPSDTPPSTPPPRRRTGWVKWAITAFAVLVMAYYVGFFGTYWREEVVLHDGSTVIATRWASRGGRHEIGQPPPIKKLTLVFTHPDTGQRISWKSESTPDVGIVNLKPIALDLVDGTPYLITVPVGCLAYNKWGRPDPPYIVFRFDGPDWQQIGIEQLPPAIERPNLIISDPDRTARMRAGKDFPFYLIRSDRIDELNSKLRQLEYQSIVRESVRRKSVGSQAGCEEVVWIAGQKSWIGARRFTSRNSLEDCNAICAYSKISEQDCPCNRFFTKE